VPKRPGDGESRERPEHHGNESHATGELAALEARQ
jgi:hypothetical protein